MKGYIKGKNIILLDSIPENLKEGDRVDISINPLPESDQRSEQAPSSYGGVISDYSFPTFELGIKDEYLDREKIYESNQDIL